MIEYEFKPDGTTFKDLSDEDKLFVRENMKATSKRPNKIPRKLFHATPQKNLTSILKNGLQPHEIFGEIYFCEKLTQCLKFIKNRPLIIFTVDTSKLNLESLYLSSDHIKRIGRNFDAYSYFEPISPELLEWRRVGD